MSEQRCMCQVQNKQIFMRINEVYELKHVVSVQLSLNTYKQDKHMITFCFVFFSLFILHNSFWNWPCIHQYKANGEYDSAKYLKNDPFNIMCCPFSSLLSSRFLECIKLKGSFFHISRLHLFQLGVPNVLEMMLIYHPSGQVNRSKCTVWTGAVLSAPQLCSATAES